MKTNNSAKAHSQEQIYFISWHYGAQGMIVCERSSNIVISNLQNQKQPLVVARKQV